MKLKDKDVREKLLEQLYSQYKEDNNTRIINELGIDFGASRVDVAVVNGILHGYEIKSESDNLSRLPRQIDYYNRLFERMTIVTDYKYYDQIKEMVPKWWGISVVERDTVRLVRKRKGRKVKQTDKMLLLKLLWKKELEGLVDVIGLPKKMKKYKKNQLLEIFNEEADLETVRMHTYEALKTRENWRA